MRIMIWGVALLLAAVAGMWIFAPAERVQTDIRFDDSRIGPDVEAYLRQAEAGVPKLRAGVEKQVVWAGAAGARTDLVVLYMHGFSATLFEIRPVPDDLARALGANLVYTRLKGHGRDGPAMAEATATGWMEDMAEALAVARQLGDRVLVVSTSTGGTLTALALPEAMAEGVVGSVFVAPNFRVNNPAGFLLTWPGVRLWASYVAGAERVSEPRNTLHSDFSTLRYPIEAVLPMAAAVKAARGLRFEDVTTPALFIFSDADQVVDSSVTRAVAARWGGPAEVFQPQLQVGDDPYAHVVAGDMLSPGQNGPVTERIIAWARALP